LSTGKEGKANYVSYCEDNEQPWDSEGAGESKEDGFKRKGNAIVAKMIFSVQQRFYC
jgi:hypothetical protein